MQRKLYLITALVFFTALSSGCSANESVKEGEEQIPPVFVGTPRGSGHGFVQHGYYRVITQTDNAYYQRPGDPNKYERPLLNYEALPDVNGETMTVKTTIGDVNVEYQFCLYDDVYNPSDPCSDPNKLYDWVIEKVDGVVSMPHVDTSGFSFGGYYVMQWKMEVPSNCQALDSFAVWQPNNVGIFMTKYTEGDGSVCYVSNPILPTKYKKMVGTYIGNDIIYSLIWGNDKNAKEIPIDCEKLYYPADDISQDICIEKHCYKHCYFLFSCD